MDGKRSRTKPKKGEIYYYIKFKEGEKPYVYLRSWEGTELDYALLNAGVVHYTEEEAEAHLREDYKKLTGRKRSENNG